MTMHMMTNLRLRDKGSASQIPLIGQLTTGRFSLDGAGDPKAVPPGWVPGGAVLSVPDADCGG
jgi:hypothetical protein